MRIGDAIADRFVLERLAGSGGMGEVYRALDRSTGSAVAVKVLHGRSADTRIRFEREARILATLDHPRVVRHVAHGALPTGEPWLAMEWLEGEDLSARLARGRLAPAEGVALALAIAEALGALHARGIVHRDLKPNNVFLVEDTPDRIKLLDFGLARSEASTRITAAGAVIGTVAYMAPEQARGDLELDARVDVFALGCVLFECLAGEPAFWAEDATAILTKLLFDEAPRLAAKLPGVPAALDALIARMLARDPLARPRDGRAAAEALRALATTDAPSSGREHTGSARRPSLTGSEERAVALIMIGAPQGGDAPDPEADARLEAEAAAHGGVFERLLNGTAAVLLSGPQVATDLAAGAARCALALVWHAGGRPLALAMGRGERTGRRAVGPAIDRAARLLGVHSAATRAVALDEVAARLVGGRFDVRNEGGVLALLGERNLAEARTLLGKPAPCVGRERELSQLKLLFDDCVEESAAQAMLVTAPPGVGKSRLAHELLRRIRERHPEAAIWVGRGDSLRAGSAFGLLEQALRGALELPEGASHEALRASFLDFLAAECARRPVLIVLEDLHWGDPQTVQLLDRALSALDERPLFVLALARPEIDDVFPRLWAERRTQTLRLTELPRKAIAELARHALGEQADAATIARLARLSEGNALCLEELIRWTVEGRGGALPETLLAMVQSRLAALDDDGRRLLRAASVFGEVFWAGGVAALVGGASRVTAVRARFEELSGLSLLLERRESRFPGEEEYAFRHALLREGAYAMLTPEDLSLGHRLAGEWLSAHGEQDPLVLAAHFEKGGDGERAGFHWLRAAELAGAAGDAAASVSYLERGLAGGPPAELRVALQEALALAREKLGA